MVSSSGLELLSGLPSAVVATKEKVPTELFLSFQGKRYEWAGGTRPRSVQARSQSFEQQFPASVHSVPHVLCCLRCEVLANWTGHRRVDLIVSR